MQARIGWILAKNLGRGANRDAQGAVARRLTGAGDRRIGIGGALFCQIGGQHAFQVDRSGRGVDDGLAGAEIRQQTVRGFA